MSKFVDVLQYEGDNTVFVWKHPRENFNSMTQLIVHESQEALFFMNGKALDLFGPGRYTLETQNLPLLGKLLKRPAGGKNPFHCEVYFINKTEQMAIKWGTDSKVEYIEPTYKFPLSIGASGEMCISVSDSRRLIVKLVGTETKLNQNQLIVFFRAFLMTKVKTSIAHAMKSQEISIFEIDENLESLSRAMREALYDDFLEYGISLDRFFVTNVAKPDGERQYETFKELYFRKFADITEARLRQQTDLIYAETEAQKSIIASKAEATKRAQEGYTYQQERSFDVADQIAQNDAIGQFTNLGVGLGTMTGIGVAMASTVGGAMRSVQENGKNICTKCGVELQSNAKFCLNCGQKNILEDTHAAACPQCGSVSSRGKFCPECGFKLITSCPKCGASMLPNAKFCAECGERV